MATGSGTATATATSTSAGKVVVAVSAVPHIDPNNSAWTLQYIRCYLDSITGPIPAQDIAAASGTGATSGSVEFDNVPAGTHVWYAFALYAASSGSTSNEDINISGQGNNVIVPELPSASASVSASSTYGQTPPGNIFFNLSAASTKQYWYNGSSYQYTFNNYFIHVDSNSDTSVTSSQTLYGYSAGSHTWQAVAVWNKPSGAPAGAPGNISEAYSGSVTVPNPIPPPPAPGTPSNGYVTSDTGSAVGIAWTGVPAGGGYSVQYNIQRNGVTIANTSATSFNDTAPGTARPVTYTVTAQSVGDGTSYSGTTSGGALTIVNSTSDSVGILLA